MPKARSTSVTVSIWRRKSDLLNYSMKELKNLSTKFKTVEPIAHQWLLEILNITPNQYGLIISADSYNWPLMQYKHPAFLLRIETQNSACTFPKLWKGFRRNFTRNHLPASQNLQSFGRVHWVYHNLSGRKVKFDALLVGQKSFQPRPERTSSQFSLRCFSSHWWMP